jgi:hypothetical protein
VAIGAIALVLASGCGVKADKVESLGATTTIASGSVTTPTTAASATVPATDTTATTDTTDTTDTTVSTDTTEPGDTTTTTAGDDTSPIQDATNVDWAANATTYDGQIGLRVRYVCPPNGTAGSVWGSGPFTDDSSVCTAAVSAGLITLAHGGKVVIRMARGLSAYVGSTRHGITTSPYGSWDSSYTFVR